MFINLSKYFRYNWIIPVLTVFIFLNFVETQFSSQINCYSNSTTDFIYNVISATLEFMDSQQMHSKPKLFLWRKEKKLFVVNDYWTWSWAQTKYFVIFYLRIFFFIFWLAFDFIQTYDVRTTWIIILKFHCNDTEVLMVEKHALPNYFVTHMLPIEILYFNFPYNSRINSFMFNVQQFSY